MLYSLWTNVLLVALLLRSCAFKSIWADPLFIIIGLNKLIFFYLHPEHVLYQLSPTESLQKKLLTIEWPLLYNVKMFLS